MNRQDWIDAARKDIRLGDAPGANYDYRSMHYLAAMAKLQMAQAEAGMPADASASPRFIEIMPRQDWEGS